MFTCFIFYHYLTLVQVPLKSSFSFYYWNLQTTFTWFITFKHKSMCVIFIPMCLPNLYQLLSFTILIVSIIIMLKSNGLLSHLIESPGIAWHNSPVYLTFILYLLCTLLLITCISTEGIGFLLSILMASLQPYSIKCFRRSLKYIYSGLQHSHWRDEF